jgi:hypothetical protein
VSSPAPAKSLSARAVPADRNLAMTTPTAKRRTITIPEEVAQGIDERIRKTGFASTDAFVEFVLARLLESGGEIPFSEEDERRLKERLRSLGYID